MKRVSEVLHERDVGARREPESESIAKRKGQISVPIGRTELLVGIPRAEISELDHARRHLDDLMETRPTPGMEEGLERSNVSVGVTRLRTTATPYLERQSRERPDNTNRGFAPDSVLERSTPDETVREQPVGVGPAVGEGSGIVVACPGRRPENITALAGQLENLRTGISGEHRRTECDGDAANEREMHWSEG